MSDALAQTFRPPSGLLYSTELLRAALELGATHLCKPMLGSLPRGDGHPVLVIPGFTAGDRSTSVLRNFLSSLGYAPSGWQQGMNFGARDELFQRVGELLAKLHEESGRPVTIVGQSLGGVYARELAKHLPHAVRQVITLGSPFNDPDGAGSSLSGLYKLFNPDSRSQQTADAERELHEAPPVPTTAIYSKFDGICHWRSCVQLDGHERTENVAVLGSHTGMGVNAHTLFVIADRLAQPHNEWLPFELGRSLGWAANAA